MSIDESSKCALIMLSLQYYKEMVDIILDDKFVIFRDGSFRRFFIKWHDCPDSNATWIQEDDLPHLDLSLLDCYLFSHSSQSSSFQPKRLMGYGVGPYLGLYEIENSNPRMIFKIVFGT